MENKELTEKICKKHCQYFKTAKKEDLACMGFLAVETLLKRGFEINIADRADSHDEQIMKVLNSVKGKLIVKKICENCPFYDDGCDFIDYYRKNGFYDFDKNAIRPCGGLIFLGHLIESNRIDIKDINCA